MQGEPKIYLDPEFVELKTKPNTFWGGWVWRQLACWENFSVNCWNADKRAIVRRELGSHHRPLVFSQLGTCRVQVLGPMSQGVAAKEA